MASQTPPTPVIAAIYARQSVSEEQGISQQLDDCRREVERRGWCLTKAHEYSDDGTSGSKERGPNTDWARMLKAFDNNEFNVLVVNDADRLTRNLADVLEVTPPKRDLRIIVVRGNIDTDQDDYMLKQFVLLAEHEVRVKTKRMQRYAAERRKKGHPTAGRTPHGYRWVPEAARDENGRRWAVDPEEADDVRRIFTEFLTGAAMKQIARDLNADGSLPKSAKSSSTRKARAWEASTVRGILMNPVYAALLPPAQPSGQFKSASINLEECTAGNWDAIVPRDQVEIARAKLAGAIPNHSGTARRWLLPGLATCSKCGGPVRSAVAKNRPKSKKGQPANPPVKAYHAYRCATIGKGCFQRAGDIIDEFVSEVMIERLAREDTADLFKRVDGTPDITALYARRRDLENRDGDIAMLIAEGKMKPKSAEKALDALNKELSTVNTQIAQAVRYNPLAELAGVENVRTWWEQATLARKRAIVGLLMEIKIHPLGYGRPVRTQKEVEKTVEITWTAENRPPAASGDGATESRTNS